MKFVTPFTGLILSLMSSSSMAHHQPGHIGSDIYTIRDERFNWDTSVIEFTPLSSPDKTCVQTRTENAVAVACFDRTRR